MTTNQPNKRLFSGAAGTLALTARRATTLTVTRAAMLLLVMMLTTMTAWAATETKTVTFYLDGGASGKTSLQDEWTLVSGGKVLHYSNTNTTVDKILLTERTSITNFNPTLTPSS